MRQRLARDTSLDRTGKQWLIKTARKQLWRVAHWMDLEDLIEDGLLCWQIVVRKYPEVYERRHLMALFQRTYLNHLHALANRRSAQVPETPVDELPDHSCADSELRQFVAEAPVDLQLLLRTILDRPELLARPLRHRIGGHRQTTNQYLCALVGLDPTQFDLHTKLRKLLKPA